jgi:hypothetical protein
VKAGKCITSVMTLAFQMERRITPEHERIIRERDGRGRAVPEGAGRIPEPGAGGLWGQDRAWGKNFSFLRHVVSEGVQVA